MSVGFYATLAGENADAARSWRGATRSWQEYSANLEQQLRDTEWRYERLELINEQTQQANQKLVQENESWKRHANELRQKVVAWQRSAIESEAISRTQGQLMIDKHGQKVSEYVGASSEEVQQMIEAKRQEVVKEWGVDPWQDN